MVDGRAEPEGNVRQYSGHGRAIIRNRQSRGQFRKHAQAVPGGPAGVPAGESLRPRVVLRARTPAGDTTRRLAVDPGPQA